MDIGYDRPLYVLPFDHRGTFQKNMFGWTGALTDEQTAKIAAMKRVIYDGFQAALAGGVPKVKAGILVDEQFGADILRDAARHGYATACPAEKSGQDEFDFEYGDDFARHIEAFRPTFCKVLVRYNPEDDRAMNDRQAGRLKRLSDYLHSGRHGRSTFELSVPPPSRFMFELLVPATPAQLAAVRRQQEGIRSGASARADGAGDHRAARRGHRAGRLEDRGDRPARGLRPGRRGRATRRAGPRRLHRPGPWRGRRQGPPVAQDRRGCARLHRLRRGPDELLGPADRLEGRPDRAGCRG